VGRKIGVAAFSTLSIDATTWHDAEWAYAKGLYNKLASNVDELDMMVSDLAKELANSNPDAIKNLKEIIWQGTGHWDATLEQRAEISGRLVLSEYTKRYIEKMNL
jgi:methylglutaconyl-CoA hydratase